MSQAYHGVTAGQHQANFNSLSAQGYRMISLSVYGNVRAGSNVGTFQYQNKMGATAR